MAVTVPSSIGDAYSRTGAAWETGPGRIYNRLAEIVVEQAPVPVTGRVVLDHGAGTGAASRAIAGEGGRPIAADAAWGMLAFESASRPPATVADATALPFSDGCFGGVVSAFCLNHALDPVPGLREIARVTAAGGLMLVASYAEDDTHAIKPAIEAALTEAGWVPADWYTEVREQATAQLATSDRVADAARAADWHDASVADFHVAFPELSVADLVSWRFGMAQYAWFLEGVPETQRAAIAARALELLGDDPPTLVRSILVLSAVR